MFHAGVVIVTNKEGSVLVLKRSDAVDSFPGYWNFPGGKPDDGEEPGDCAARECFEETSISIDPADLYYLDVVKGKDEEFIYFFIYENCDQHVVIDWESSEYRWVSPRELFYLKMIPMPKEFVEMIAVHLKGSFK